MKFKIIAVVVAIIAIVAAGYIWYRKGLSEGVGQAEIAVSVYEKQLGEMRTELANKQVQIVERVITNYHTNTETIRQVVHDNQATIREVVRPAEGSTNLSVGWVYAHDQSVHNLPVDSVLASQNGDSGVSPAEGLIAVTGNYSIANQNAEQLRALQDWIRQTHDSQTTINRDAARKHSVHEDDNSSSTSTNVSTSSNGTNAAASNSQ